MKDAYDATLAVVQAFAKNRDSLFIISTHITEVRRGVEGRVQEYTLPVYAYPDGKYETRVSLQVDGGDNY